jgi:hypothetical protein
MERGRKRDSEITIMGTFRSYSLRPFTLEELNARIDQAEAEIATGLGTPHEEVMREMDEEIERWEQEDLKLEAV